MLLFLKALFLSITVAQIDQTTKDNVEIANESAIISSTVSDIANNILEDVKKKRF
nr:methyl-accepting chemotaxis protein [Campylobacter jejuni]